MTVFTRSMKGLVVTSQGKTHTLTGWREYNPAELSYTYQTEGGAWIDGKAMQFASGGIERQFEEN